MKHNNLAYSKPKRMSWHFSSLHTTYIFVRTVAPTSDNVLYQYRCYRHKSQMDKNEAILKSYRFLNPSIMTTGRKISMAAKVKAEGKKINFGATVQKCMWCVATKNAKTFSLVLNTLNLHVQRLRLVNVKALPTLLQRQMRQSCELSLGIRPSHSPALPPSS